MSLLSSAAKHYTCEGEKFVPPTPTRGCYCSRMHVSLEVMHATHSKLGEAGWGGEWGISRQRKTPMAAICLRKLCEAPSKGRERMQRYPTVIPVQA